MNNKAKVAKCNNKTKVAKCNQNENRKIERIDDHLMTNWHKNYVSTEKFEEKKYQLTFFVNIDT